MNGCACLVQVINGSPATAATPAARGEGRRRGASSPARAAPEKRRWPAEPYDDELAARAPSSDDDDTKVGPRADYSSMEFMKNVLCYSTM